MQRPYDLALALASKRFREVPDADLLALGTRLRSEEQVDFPVLDCTVTICRSSGEITLEGQEVPVSLAICVLHHLTTAHPERLIRGGRRVSFREIPEVRGYFGPYSARVLRRLTRHFGPEGSGLDQAARAVGGAPEAIGDLGYRFDFFPRVPVWLAYFRGDEELAPEANLLYPATITDCLPGEDIIILSEWLAARLCGAKWG